VLPICPPLIWFAAIVPVEVREVSIPTEVMLPCAAVIKVPCSNAPLLPIKPACNWLVVVVPVTLS